MPTEEQIKAGARVIQAAYEPGYRAALTLARRVLEAVEGKWDSGKFFDRGGPDHDGLTGKPFAGPTPVPCDHERELRRLRHVETDLISLSWQMHDAVGDKGPGPGSPRQYLDMLIAERDAVAAQVKLLMDEVEHLRGRQAAELPEPGPVHEVEIMHERTHGDWAEIRIKCPYPACGFDMTLAGPVASDVNDMVPALAEAHREDMEEEEPDAEG